MLHAVIMVKVVIIIDEEVRYVMASAFIETSIDEKEEV
jgi:hypothetical protein